MSAHDCALCGAKFSVNGGCADDMPDACDVCWAKAHRLDIAAKDRRTSNPRNAALASKPLPADYAERRAAGDGGHGMVERVCGARDPNSLAICQRTPGHFVQFPGAPWHEDKGIRWQDGGMTRVNLWPESIPQAPTETPGERVTRETEEAWDTCWSKGQRADLARRIDALRTEDEKRWWDEEATRLDAQSVHLRGENARLTADLAALKAGAVRLETENAAMHAEVNRLTADLAAEQERGHALRDDLKGARAVSAQWQASCQQARRGRDDAAYERETWILADVRTRKALRAEVAETTEEAAERVRAQRDAANDLIDKIVTLAAETKGRAS